MTTIVPFPSRGQTDIVRPPRDDAGDVAYDVAYLTLGERTRLDADLYRLGARPVAYDEVLAALREATAALEEPEREVVVQALERWDAIRTQSSETPPDDAEGVTAIVRRWEDAALRISPEYAETVAAYQYYLACYAQLLVRYGVRGWRGLSGTYAAQGGVMTERAYETIPVVDRMWLAAEVARRCRLDEAQAGN